MGSRSSYSKDIFRKTTCQYSGNDHAFRDVSEAVYVPPWDRRMPSVSSKSRIRALRSRTVRPCANSTKKSTSLSGRASPRAIEPTLSTPSIVGSCFRRGQAPSSYLYCDCGRRGSARAARAGRHVGRWPGGSGPYCTRPSVSGQATQPAGVSRGFPRSRAVRGQHRRQSILQDRARRRASQHARPSGSCRGRVTDRDAGGRAGGARDSELSGQIVDGG